MKCPHCLENFFEGWEYLEMLGDVDGNFRLRYCTCPSCKKIIIELGKLPTGYRMWDYSLVRPKGISRAPLSPNIPQEFTNDYKEACLVFSDSPKASAALSRRCLQNLLKEKANTTKKDLSEQIEEVLNSNSLPPYLSENLDAVRNIGNFAAHPIKSKSTGEIVDVEPGEAEWNLDILESLFDFYFIQKQKIQEKRDALNKKLGDAGKPQMK